MSIPSGEEMREMLRFNTQYGLDRIDQDEAARRPKRTATLVARKLCPHHSLETIGLVQNRLRIRCMDCGATAIHREKK